MLRKMISIIICFFFFGLIECEDWCPLIAPDGNYKELGVTRHWKGFEERDAELVMFNRYGNEWLFNITADDNYSPQSVRIEMIEGSVRKGPDSDVINRFGIYVKSTPFVVQGVPTDISYDIRLRKEVCLRNQSLIKS